jgi:hypothetical protein
MYGDFFTTDTLHFFCHACHRTALLISQRQDARCFSCINVLYISETGSTAMSQRIRIKILCSFSLFGPTYSAFPTLISNTSFPGFNFNISMIAARFSSVTTVYSGHILPSRLARSQCILNSWICSPSAFLYFPMNSAQLGLSAIVEVICLLRDFREGLEEVSSKMISCRLEVPRRKRMGMEVDMVLAATSALCSKCSLRLGGLMDMSMWCNCRSL